MKHPTTTAELALKEFIETIDQTGGVTQHTGKNDGGPVTDPEWLDLGDAYRTACAAMQHTPLEITDES